MKKLLYLLAFTVSIAGLQAQETTITSGGEASGDGGTVSYSVGQVVYGTQTGTTGSVTEGVQQPFEISVIIGIEELGINLNISAYPNPFTDHLILYIDDDIFSDQDRWIASVYDINGAVIKQQIIVANETTIDMADQIAGIYFLKISSENQEIKTFKIIKNK